MVIYSDTLIPLHELTEEGKDKWNEFALKEFSFRTNHPVLAFLKRMLSI